MNAPALDPEFVRLRDRLAQAKRERRDVGKHQERLEAHVRDRLAHDVCVTAARAEAELEALRSLIARRPWIFRDIEKARRMAEARA